MRIAFFTEGGYQGKVPREHIDIRTDMAWVCSLGATHHPIPTIHEIPSDSYDVGVIIIPKKRRHLLWYPVVENMKRVCKKVAAMQEAVLWYWQDSPVDEQIWYFNVMAEMDFSASLSCSLLSSHTHLAVCCSSASPSDIL